ncbi:MAG: hypothetical protein KAQ92_06925, partial [Candidatus Aenigmarchaeota archaeon]|nr:hypothetical protein [Candidatus Aenigmarchaeota archaeon]
MANQKLVDWIKNQRAEGYSYNQIYDALIQHGYDSNEVDEAIKIVDTIKTDNPTDEVSDETTDESTSIQPTSETDDETIDESKSDKATDEINEITET